MSTAEGTMEMNGITKLTCSTRQIYGDLHQQLSMKENCPIAKQLCDWEARQGTFSLYCKIFQSFN